MLKFDDYGFLACWFFKVIYGGNIGYLAGILGLKEAAERLADCIELLPSWDLLWSPPSLGIEVGYLSLLNYYRLRGVKSLQSYWVYWLDSK